MIDVEDRRRLENALSRLDVLGTEQALGLAADACLRAADAGEFSRSADLHHIGLLVFPDQVSDVIDFLRISGLAVRAPIRSTVVRGRLAVRYARDVADLDVFIVSATMRRDPSREVEVFVLPGIRDRADEDGMVVRERRGELESHVAFRLRPGTLESARRLVAKEMGLTAEGGGYNPDEQADEGGRSVFYFAAHSEGPGRGEYFHRVELFVSGHHEEQLDEHLARSEVGSAVPETRLFELITGHWATQALSLAVEMRLPDLLALGAMSGEQVALESGMEPAAVSRFLRYLSSLGVIRSVGDGYASTPVLELLCDGKHFGDLVRLYGDEFYRTWGELRFAMRTGKNAFGHLFGKEHFEYFGDRPDLSRRFDSAMAATTHALADRVCEVFDFSGVGSVVDVGGGDGTLLTKILVAAPAAIGVLLEQKRVVEGASAPHAERLTLVEGDFFENVPVGGDVYVLSRVLHDWSDEDCARLLSRCRDAMNSGARLLVVERVLPEHPIPSTAFSWDMQMLVITGGRERTRAEYARLMTESGYVLDSVTELKHGLSLLEATAT